MKPLHKTLLKIYNILFNTFGPQHWWPGDTPFEIAVGAILTQNTNWSNVERAINNLKDNGALDPEVLYRMPITRLARLIRPAGYFNVKAKRLKNFITFLVERYGGSMDKMRSADPTSLREELLSINGIGPETADSILLYALDMPVFVIDAYTKRVLTRHGLADGKESYDELQALFHKNLDPDKDLYNEFHALFVRIGKEYCKPRPRCESCPLNRKGLYLKK
jgi:endonuclease-3 related protein